MRTPTFQGRVYELRQGHWTEVGGTAARSSVERSFAGFVAGALAIAASAAIAIVAAALTVVLLPIGLVLVWLASRRRVG
jgi:hypothetical protein